MHVCHVLTRHYIIYYTMTSDRWGSDQGPADNHRQQSCLCMVENNTTTSNSSVTGVSMTTRDRSYILRHRMHHALLVEHLPACTG